MTHTLAALIALALTTSAALAQSYPGDTGAGVQRGIQQLNNSGEIGTVTLFGAGTGTHVVVELHGTPGRAQAVKLVRGASCDDLAGGTPAYVLSDVANGHSATLVKATVNKLLSGNYNVVVLASNRANARASACGHLYAS